MPHPSNLINNSEYQLIIHWKQGNGADEYIIIDIVVETRGENKFDSTSSCPAFSLQIDTFLQSSNQKLLLLWLSEW